MNTEGLLSAFKYSRSGISAQTKRMQAISENMANIDVTRTPSGQPFIKNVTIFSNDSSGTLTASVKKVSIENAFKTIYRPSHPDADKNGFVKIPKIDNSRELIDMTEASRSLESNIASMEMSKRMLMKTLDLLK